MFRANCVSALIALSVPATALAAEDHDHSDQHAFEVGGLDIVHPWTNATSQGDTLVFMELHNEGDAPVTLIGASSDAALTADLVGFSVAGGVITPVPLGPVDIAPGRSMELVPDVMAIRLTGLTRALSEGGHLDLTVMSSVGNADIEVAVESATARQHSHAGHAH